MESIFTETEDSWSEKLETEVVATLVHKTKLLRVRNWLCCPLLRLPAETVIQILTYIMEDTEDPHAWRPIHSSCYRMNTTMNTTTDLWRKADFTLDRTSHLKFVRSMGKLQEIRVDFCPWENQSEWTTQEAMNFCRDNVVLNGRALHTVGITGFPSDIPHWSWIFERPLPRLHRLKIHFVPSDDDGPNPLATPVVLKLPPDLPLRVLDLCNARLPWSSNLFAGLTELHMVFSDCDPFVEIPEDELLSILVTSPQLKRLSLVELTPIGPDMNVTQPAPTQIVRLPSLTFLKLAHKPEFVVRILSLLEIPAITSFEIHSLMSDWETDVFVDLCFPDDHLPNRVFPNPPVFGVWDKTGYAYEDSLMVTIGSAKMQFDFDMEELEPACYNIMTCIHPFVPPSVTTLRLGYSGLNEEEWTDFFSAHPEVRSIECTESGWDPVSESVWEALSPTGPAEVPLCSKLESISVYNIPEPTPLLNCLRSRKNARGMLRHPKLWGVDDMVAREFRSLVEEFQVLSKSVSPAAKVCLVPTDELDMR